MVQNVVDVRTRPTAARGHGPGSCAARAKFASTSAPSITSALDQPSLSTLRRQRLGLRLIHRRLLDDDQFTGLALATQRHLQDQAHGPSWADHAHGCVPPDPWPCRPCGTVQRRGRRDGHRRCPSGDRSSWSSTLFRPATWSCGCQPASWRAASARPGAGCPPAARDRRSRPPVRPRQQPEASRLITSVFISLHLLARGRPFGLLQSGPSTWSSAWASST